MGIELNDRFWSKVNKTDTCWLWTASNCNGYGRFLYQGKLWVAHRISYSAINGEIPEGEQIDHKCHTPSCVNPEHLQSVAPALNSQNRKGAQANSTTGVRGVYWHAEGKKYVAQGKLNQKTVHLGLFSRLEDAATAAKEWREKNHPNSLMDRAA